MQATLGIGLRGRDVQQMSEFRRRIREEYLPSYLADCGYQPGGYRGGDEIIPSVEASWFLRALDEGIVQLLPKGRLKLPAGSVNAMIFWEHDAGASPRPVSLHIEGVLSAAMAARLQVEFGWPVEALAFEYPPGPRTPGRRAFDLGALESGELVLAGEAKTRRAEMDHVLQAIDRCN
jgi:hypothetical protein